MTMQIRPQQLHALKVSAIENFIDRVVLHLRECFPERCADLGEQDTRAVVRLGIDLAQSYGIDREVCVCEFIDLMFIFGIGCVDGSSGHPTYNRRWTCGP